eukprot:COSAG04_NODE_1082_length_8397_cov_3.936009_3_plen_143_part_00
MYSRELEYACTVQLYWYINVYHYGRLRCPRRDAARGMLRSRCRSVPRNSPNSRPHGTASRETVPGPCGVGCNQPEDPRIPLWVSRELAGHLSTELFFFIRARARARSCTFHPAQKSLQNSLRFVLVLVFFPLVLRAMFHPLQ